MLSAEHDLREVGHQPIVSSHDSHGQLAISYHSCWPGSRLEEYGWQCGLQTHRREDIGDDDQIDGEHWLASSISTIIAIIEDTSC